MNWSSSRQNPPRPPRVAGCLHESEVFERGEFVLEFPFRNLVAQPFANVPQSQSLRRSAQHRQHSLLALRHILRHAQGGAYRLGLNRTVTQPPASKISGLGNPARTVSSSILIVPRPHASMTPRR